MGGGRGQREGERAVAVANGGARADVWAKREGDAGTLASAEGQHAREKGRVQAGGGFHERVVPLFVLEFGWCHVWTIGLVHFLEGEGGSRWVGARGRCTGLCQGCGPAM
jgi:hypothetical protein